MKISPFKRIIIAAVAGSLIGWLVSEPWENDFSYERDLFIIISISFFLWLSFSLYNYIYFKRFDIIKEKKKRFLYVFIPLIGTIVIKVLLTSPPEKTYMIDQTTDVRILLLDISSSMQGEKIIELKNAISHYLDLLKKFKSKDKIGVITFSDDAKIVSEPISNYNKLEKIVSHLETVGGTNMSSGLILAKSELEKKAFLIENKGKSEIILVSDGLPNSVDRVRKIVNNYSPYSISAIGVGDSYDKIFLQQIANITNGNFYDAEDIKNLQPIFIKVAGQGGIVEITNDNKKENISIITRLFAWIMYGLFIGLSVGLFENERKEIIIGTLGGALGGFLGGIFFIIFGAIGLTGPLNRFITFTIFAIILALALWTTRQIYNKITVN